VAVERPVEVLRAAAAALGLAVPWCADVNAVLQASRVAWGAQAGGVQLVA
jgi:hypothetical protein